jgi:hypothetical protein
MFHIAFTRRICLDCDDVPRPLGDAGISMLSLHVDKRSLQVRKVAGIQQLNPCIVLAVKGSRSVSASGIVGVGGRIKPQSQMIHLERPGGGIRRHAGKSIVESKRSVRYAGRYYKRFDAETANKDFSAISFAVGLNIALIPRDAERLYSGPELRRSRSRCWQVIP